MRCCAPRHTSISRHSCSRSARSALGDQEAAIAFCEAAVEARDMSMALFMRWWPDFERVRADDRFVDIARRFNSRPASRI